MKQVYGIFERGNDGITGSCLYVGQTNNLSRRIREHVRSGVIDSIFSVFVKTLYIGNDCDSKEMESIKRYDNDKMLNIRGR